MTRTSVRSCIRCVILIRRPTIDCVLISRRPDSLRRNIEAVPDKNITTLKTTIILVAPRIPITGIGAEASIVARVFFTKANQLETLTTLESKIPKPTF